MGRPKGSRNKPKQPTEASQNPPEVSEVKEKPKRAQKAVSGAKKVTGAAAKAARQKALSAAPEQVAENPKFQNTETSGNSQPQQRAIIDLTTGQVVSEIPDFKAIPDIYYSHSFVKDIHSCTAKAYFRKSKAPSRKVFALERGTVAHTLIEGWEKEDKDPVAGLPDAWKHYILDNKDQFSPEDQEKIEKGFTDTQRMLAEFVAENAEIKHRIRPEDVEVPFKILVTINTAAGPIQRWLVGKIDLVLFNEQRTEFGIIDWKTSAKAPHASELEIGVQFCTYELAAKEIYGKYPKYMTYYLLNGEHLCSERFSSVKHPRELGSRVPGCELTYAIKVPRKTPKQIQAMLDEYYAGAIYKWELGIVNKDGKHDPRGQCSMCQYKEFCDSFDVKSLPPPVFLK